MRKYLGELYKTYKGSFPDLCEIEDDVERIYSERKRNERTRSQPRETGWISRKAPGTPAHFEALFSMIEKGKADTGAFRIGCRMKNISEDEIWGAYESWTQGKVHKIIQDKVDKIQLSNLLKGVKK